MQSTLNRYPDMVTLAGVTSRAIQIFEEDGAIRLGDFVNALIKGTSKVKYGACLSTYWPRFVGITGGQRWHIYEMLLAQLEHTKGPLFCLEDRPSSCPCGRVWGYAASSDSRVNLADVAILSSPERRWRALEAGHPDNRAAMSCGTMPSTSWRRIAPSLNSLDDWDCDRDWKEYSQTTSA